MSLPRAMNEIKVCGIYTTVWKCESLGLMGNVGERFYTRLLECRIFVGK